MQKLYLLLPSLILDLTANTSAFVHLGSLHLSSVSVSALGPVLWVSPIPSLTIPASGLPWFQRTLTCYVTTPRNEFGVRILLGSGGSGRRGGGGVK